MIAAHKAKSENEAMTTKPAKDTTELGHWIAKLMANLTRAQQGNSPNSTPNSPDREAMGVGWTDRSTPCHPSSHNGQTGLGHTASVCSASVICGTGITTTRGQGPNTQGSKEGTSNRKDPSSLQCFRCQSWGHMAQECTTPAKTLNQSRGNWQNTAQPPANTSHNSQQ